MKSKGLHNSRLSIKTESHPHSHPVEYLLCLLDLPRQSPLSKKCVCSGSDAPLLCGPFYFTLFVDTIPCYDVFFMLLFNSSTKRLKTLCYLVPTPLVSFP